MKPILSRLVGTSCIALITLPALAHEPDVVLDDADSANVEYVPSANWVAETDLTNALRTSSRVTTGSAVNTGEYARFHTRLPKAGPWQVFAWHNGRNNFADALNVEVTHADAAATVVKVNGESYAGQWQLLGTFWFEGNDNGLNDCKEAEVKFIHNDAGLVSVDAVRFSMAEPVAVLDSTSSSSGITLSPSSGSWGSVTAKAGNAINIRRGSATGATVAFKPVLPTPGDYDVSLWLPATTGAWLPSGGTAAASVSVDVHSRGSTVTTVSVSLPANGTNEGSWVRVVNPNSANGTFRFDHNTAPVETTKLVVKTPGNGQWVPADAVRFEKRGTFGVYMDEDDPSGVVRNPAPGTWSVVGATRSAQTWLYHKNLMFGSVAQRASAATSQSMAYTPALPELGLYDLYAWWPIVTNNSHTTQVKVESTLPLVTRVADQEQPGGQWIFSGRYIMSPSAAKVTVQTPGANDGNIVGDAVLFLRDGEETDADNDGLPDAWETVLGTDIVGVDGNDDTLIRPWDTDGDGMSDGDEYRLGRDPRSAASDAAGVLTLNLHTPTTR